MSQPTAELSSTLASGVAGAPARSGGALTERYQLEALIGSGGMGVVWRATDRSLGRQVAIKLVSMVDALARARFTREARVTSGVDHPGVVRVFDVGAEGSVAFLVMELLHGETLGDRAARAPLSMPDTLRVVAEIAEAMAFAHARTLVHRDLKPDNVFLRRVGDVEQAVIIDFGLAFAREGDADVGRLTQAELTCGTPAYMAPEQTRADPLTAAADVYALGCIFMELLTGAPPFTGGAAVLLSKHAFAAPPTLRERWPEAPIALDDLVGAMLAKRPDDRPSMAEVQARTRALMVRVVADADGNPTMRDRVAVAASPRSQRAIGRAAPAEGAAVSGRVTVVGDLADGFLLGLALRGLAASRGGPTEAAGADAVVAAGDLPTLRSLAALGPPVVAVIAPLSMALLTELIRAGVSDAVAATADVADLGPKVERAIRWAKDAT